MTELETQKDISDKDRQRMRELLFKFEQESMSLEALENIELEEEEDIPDILQRLGDLELGMFLRHV
jgi:hypothetical protein